MSNLKTNLLYLAIPFMSVMVGYQGLQAWNNNAEPVAAVNALIPTPQVIKELDGLGGYKEDDSVDPKKTIYVFYDPTCPGCHAVFDASRKKIHLKDGLTMKWIPTTVLGDEPSSVGAAIYGLTASSEKEQADIFSLNKPSGEFNEKNTKAVAKNNEYLKVYSSLNTGILAVPTVIYVNQEKGDVTVSYNIPDDPYLLRVIDGVS